MQTKHDIDVNFFPGWTRKSVTFTIDDGNVKYDKMFLDIVKPAGILGTFNLCSHIFSSFTPEGYRDFYRGYEIANHCKYHPIVFDDGMPYTVADEPFDPLTSLDYTPENPVVYKNSVEGTYRIHHHIKRIKPDGWYTVATPGYYIKYIDDCKAELETVFGEGSVRGFVWPCYKQTNSEVIAHLKSKGYYGIRKTGQLLDSTCFALPEDRMDWTYTAGGVNLLSAMELYENYPDDGNLKFFCFGLHAVDYERDNKWDDLRLFAEKYGNRPEDYYYASNADIFDYEDAVKKIEIIEPEIKNPSEISLYIKVDGARVILRPKSVYKF